MLLENEAAKVLEDGAALFKNGASLKMEPSIYICPYKGKKFSSKHILCNIFM